MNNITAISDSGTYIWIIDRTLNQHRCLRVGGIGANHKTRVLVQQLGLIQK